jgi:hypothetical protein
MNVPGFATEGIVMAPAQMNTRATVFTSRATHIAALMALLFVCAGCGRTHQPQPSIQITRVPPSDPGGPQKLDFIEGSVQGAQPGQQVVLYTHSGIWWVQPFAAQPTTKILPNGTWKNSTHLGTEYASLLVDANYRPQVQTSALPEPGNGVIAVAVAKGTPNPSFVAKTLRFSGYDWVVRSAGSDRGGEPNEYSPENAWVDQKGFLHLSMQDRNGKWTCAEVYLTRSLGYGTYKFVVQDSAHLSPSGVFGLFTWDLARSQDFRNEIDIELSRWGDPKSKNAQYVIQPFYVPENVSRFTVPGGEVTHSFRWEPDKVSFMSTQGARGSSSAPISRHVFTSGIPSPADEAVHINLYDFRHSKNPVQQPSEVVIEKFEYLP